MNKRIIDDAVQLLKDAGWQPMVCDTAVSYFDNGVPAGIPQDVGEYSGERVMLPKEIMGYEPMIMFRVRGESMCGAGIENGDMVTLLLDTNVEDGDIVVAWLDGEATLKVFYRDEAGEPWLVPQNDKYQPIRLRDFTNVWILGKVVDVKKHLPRVPFRHIQQYMKNVKREQGDSPDDAKLKRAIARIAKQMPSSRHWFCIYRVMVDKEMLAEGDFYGLRDKINELFPDNDFGINPRDLQRLDVCSFHKRVHFWDEHDAPVQGKRFYEYLTIANAFKDMLS